MHIKTPPEHPPEFYKNALAAEVARVHEYPAGRFAGRGIVIVAGRQKYLSGAWASVSMLRDFGVTLPIQLWYFGDEEFDDALRALFSSKNVECIDARAMLATHPSARLSKSVVRGDRFALFELKCYAIVHSRFEELLFLDADNVILANPQQLFENPAYLHAGAMFWPDPPYGAHPPDAEAWKACGLPAQHGPAFETGQIVIDKRRCWHPLQVAWSMNEHSDYWFRVVHGDKDIYKLAWHVVGLPYALAPMASSTLAGVLQYSPAGTPMFYHRWFSKPTLHDTRLRCRAATASVSASYTRALAALRASWNGRLWDDAPRDPGDAGTYRTGDGRLVILKADGTVVSLSSLEHRWHMHATPRGPVMVLQGTDCVTCFLHKNGDRWEGHDKRTNSHVMLKRTAATTLPLRVGAQLKRVWTMAIRLSRFAMRIAELAAIAMIGGETAGALRKSARNLLLRVFPSYYVS